MKLKYVTQSLCRDRRQLILLLYPEDVSQTSKGEIYEMGPAPILNIQVIECLEIV